MTAVPPLTTMAVEELHFDRENPRLAEFGVNDRASDEEILVILWDAMDVRELVQSIAASGFFQHEPIIVTNEGRGNVVIEGNRRLAAVKVLLDPQLARQHGWEAPNLPEAARERLKTIPVL